MRMRWTPPARRARLGGEREAHARCVGTTAAGRVTGVFGTNIPNLPSTVSHGTMPFPQGAGGA